MKKNMYALCIAGAMLAMSCNGNKSDNGTLATTSDTIASSMTSTTDNTSNKMATDTINRPATNNRPVRNPDVVNFVQKAIPGGTMEVEMGKMAASQGQNQRVKDFGNMLVKDHTAAGDELKGMAKANNINVPADMTPEQKSYMDMLMNKSGAAFDKAYMDMMVSDHKKDIAEYKKASTTLTDDTYKAFAGKTLPVLQRHLDSAQAIKKNL